MLWLVCSAFTGIQGSVFLGSGKRHLSPLVPQKLVGYCSVTFPLSPSSKSTPVVAMIEVIVIQFLLIFPFSLLG